jgi:TetR/AcrR family transcriptional regulator, cholesterol catabolism regulator
MEQRIIEKAQELFFRYGLKSVTMDDIATKLGVSKKTIYQYFADKEALVEGVVQREIDHDVTECQSHITLSENAVHETFLALDMLQEMLSTMNPAIIYEMQKYHPQAFSLFNDHKNKFLYKVIKENLDRGQKEGLYREDFHSDILAKFRIESIFVAFNPEVFPPTKYNLVKVETEIMEHFLFGICTAKGQKQIEKYKKQREKTNHS